MQVFRQNPNRIIGGYSEELEREFLEHMKRSHRFSRAAATVVYNEYISDRHHIHMNSTHWATLTAFVKYLGRTGKCKVEETPKGWFITYIDQDSETFFKERLKSKRLKSDVEEEEKHERVILKLIERAEQLMPTSASGSAMITPLPSSEPCGKVAFSLGLSSKPVVTETAERPKPVFEEFQGEKNSKTKSGVNLTKSGGSSALDELMEELEKAKEKTNRKDYWLCEGIIVKVTSKALADKGYYKQKGVVKKVIHKYVGEIEMLDSKHVLRVDQEELETVIPQIGGLVRIVNGAYRGSNARLLSVDTYNYCPKVQIDKGI